MVSSVFPCGSAVGGDERDVGRGEVVKVGGWEVCEVTAVGEGDVRWWLVVPEAI